MGICLLKCKYLLTFFRSYFTNNYKLIGIANSFSGGIFLCVALLHLLPESTEIFEKHYTHKNNEGHTDKDEKHFPISFLLAFCGYTIILLIEKVISPSHSHHSCEEDDESLDDHKEHKEDYKPPQNIINVNNNYNITVNPPKEDFQPNKKTSHNGLSLNGGSVSMLSKNRDKINEYLHTFKITSEELKEEHFKNLFSTYGKISNILLENDRKYFNLIY